MLALDRETGATDWESNVTDSLGPPMVQGDAIVVRGFDADETSSRRYAIEDQSIHGIDATTGEERWTALTRDADAVAGGFFPLATTREMALFMGGGSDDAGATGTTYALSLADGSTRWTAGDLHPGVVRVHDGTIAYGASTRSAHRDADVIAFEPDGSRRWEWSPDTDRLFSSVSSTAIVCGHVIVTSAREEPDADPEHEYVVHGLDVETGQPRWTLDARTPASLSTHRGRLLVTDDTLRHLDPASGDPVWTVDMGVSAIGYGMVFSGWGTAVDIQDGTTVWDQSFQEPVRMKRVADGRIVMTRRTNESDHIGAIDATTGEQAWDVEPEHEFQTSNGLAVGTQRAYVIDQKDPDNSDPGVTGEYGEKGTVRAVRI
jgi:outer membrane protein assembly factor BamB